MIMYTILYVMNSFRLCSAYLAITWNVVPVEQIQLQQALVELVDVPVCETEEAVLLVDLHCEGVVDSLNLHVLCQSDATSRIERNWSVTQWLSHSPRSNLSKM